MKRKIPFAVSVTAAKYNGWRSGEMYQKAGGLWGLCIGADRMRNIKVKVRIKRWVPWSVSDDVLEELEMWHDFEKIFSGVMNSNSPYLPDYAMKEAVIELRGDNEEEQKQEIKRVCEDIKKETIEIVEEIFNEIGEFETDNE